MLHKNSFYAFVVCGILLIFNTIYLYPWQFQLSLIESSWIVLGTLAAIVAYYLALLSSYAPFQTFIMRIIFWGYSGMFFLSVLRRALEYISNQIIVMAYLNTLLYVIMLVLTIIEGKNLYYSYGKSRLKKNK